MAGVPHTYLESVHTGTVTGANNIIEVLPPLCDQGTLVAPDDVKLDFTTNQESAGAGGAPCTVNLTIDNVPALADTFEIGTEQWTWAAARIQPFQVARGADAAACAINAIAAINADTRLALVADLAALLVRVRSAASPGGTVEFGNRTGALTTATNIGGIAGWDVANLNLGGGAGLVSGGPQWSVIERRAGLVRIQVRGMRAGDSLSYRCVCRRAHPIGRVQVPTKVSGVNDLVTTLGSRTVTSASGGFVAAGVLPGDWLVIHNSDPNNRACNGIYKIEARNSPTSLLLAVDQCPLGMKATLPAGNVTYTIGPGQLVLDQDTGIAQVPFDLPASTAHTAAAPATDAELPAQAVQTVEIADQNCNDLKLGADRGKTGSMVIGAAGAVTDISAYGIPADLTIVTLAGGVAQITLAAVAGLNTGALIAAALSANSVAVAQGVAFRFDIASGRYIAYRTATTTATNRGSTIPVLAITAGVATDLAGPLLLTAGAGASAVAANDNLDESKAADLIVPAMPGTITEPMLSADVKLTRAQIAMDLTSPPTADAGKGVVLGSGDELLITPQGAPDMTVRLTVNGTAISNTGAKGTVATAPLIIPITAAAGLPRCDLVYYSPALGSLGVIDGVAADPPLDPALPAGFVPLARVIVPVGAASISNGAGGTGWIVDLRSRSALAAPAVPGLTIGGLTPSTDISTAGANADLRVNVNGGGLTALTIPNPGAFPLYAPGGGVAAPVALNSAPLIVAALNQLAAQAGQACTFSYDATANRYLCRTNRQLAGDSIVIAAGLVNDISAALLLNPANTEASLATTSLLDARLQAQVQLPVGAIRTRHLGPLQVDTAALGNLQVTNSKIADAAIAVGKLAFQPALDLGELSSFAVHFQTGAFPQGQTIQIAVGDTWTGAAADDPANRQFISGAGIAADLASFVAGVNNAASPSVARAIDAGGNVGMVFARVAATALAGVSSHANAVIVQTKALVAAADKTIAQGTYTLDAGGLDIGRLAAGDEILLGAFQGVGGLIPRLKSLRRTAAVGAAESNHFGLVVTLRLYAADNIYAVCLADAGAILANSDVLDWTVIY